MKTKTILVAVGSIGIALSFGLSALIAQTPADRPPANPPSHNMMGMDMMNMSPQQCRDMMKKMGMSEAMMTRCQIMGNAQISAYDPAAVLAMSHELKLTSEQIKDLEAIAAATQEQVKAKLTGEQLAVLQPIATTPGSMADFCQTMHTMSGKDMKGMMMCPMTPTSAPDGNKTSQKSNMSCCPWMSP